MQNEEGYKGILMDIVTNEHGEAFVGINLGAERRLFSVEQAACVYDMLGGLLESVGFFDDEGDYEDEADDAEGAKCKMH